MKLIKVGAAVLNQVPLDWNGNRDRIVTAIERAREQEVSILCCPELCLTGYGCEDAFHSPGVQRTAFDLLHDIVEQTRGIVVSVGLPVHFAGGLFNAACLLCDGRIVGFVGKQHLAGDGIHYEPRWFKAWPTGCVGEIATRQGSVPIGDLMFSCGDVRIGFEICEDAWVGERPGGRQASRAVDLILNPSASHFAFGKHEIRRRFVLEGSRAFFVTYVYANLLGNESGRAIYDGDAMIAADGNMLASGERFSFAEVSLTTAVTDIELSRMLRARSCSYRPLTTTTPQLIDVGFELSESKLQSSVDQRPAWELSQHRKFEEFTRAEALGLLDYLRKSRSRGFVISLSGGADSGAVAVLVQQMVTLALKELGWQGLRDKLAGCANLPEDVEDDAPAQIKATVKRLLTTLYQATSNSSDTTREAAEQVARAIGAEHHAIDVDELVAGYRSRIEGCLGRELTWEQDDVALQNIQARVRSPGLWMLANVLGGLLLSTSNRSEAAVGYATMDGDTSGGLAPIAGIDKAFLREWLVWMETEGPIGSSPLPELAAINRQQPTAELRPQEQNQTDEDDLMPYPVLDAIERWAIRDKRLPVEVVPCLRHQFPKVSEAQAIAWTRKFFQLWCRNQWKRERYAPSFHLDDENLDPKTWCRFPILSSGFRLELERLANELEN